MVVNDCLDSVPARREKGGEKEEGKEEGRRKGTGGGK